VARETAGLDICRLMDDCLDKLDDLPRPDVLQQVIIDHLEAALLAFRDVAAALPASAPVAASPASAPAADQRKLSYTAVSKA